MFKRDRGDRQLGFADIPRAAGSVPEEHRLLHMRRAVDWQAIEKSLARYYDAWTGRPGFPPALLVRMLVLEYYADLSDREVEEQAGYNLLYRAFLGLSMDDRVPDSTTLVRFRERVGEEGIRKVFAEVNGQLEAAGLVGSDRRVLDGVHMWAKVARQSWVGLMRTGRQKVYEALENVEPDRAKAIREDVEPADPATEARGGEADRMSAERPRREADGAGAPRRGPARSEPVARARDGPSRASVGRPFGSNGSGRRSSSTRCVPWRTGE